jgi:hypothetical protein
LLLRHDSLVDPAERLSSKKAKKEATDESAKMDRRDEGSRHNKRRASRVPGTHVFVVLPTIIVSPAALETNQQQRQFICGRTEPRKKGHDDNQHDDDNQQVGVWTISTTTRYVA